MPGSTFQQETALSRPRNHRLHTVVTFVCAWTNQNNDIKLAVYKNKASQKRVISCCTKLMSRLGSKPDKNLQNQNQWMTLWASVMVLDAMGIKDTCPQFINPCICAVSGGIQKIDAFSGWRRFLWVDYRHHRVWHHLVFALPSAMVKVPVWLFVHLPPPSNGYETDIVSVRLPADLLLIQKTRPTKRYLNAMPTQPRFIRLFQRRRIAAHSRRILAPVQPCPLFVKSNNLTLSCWKIFPSG